MEPSVFDRLNAWLNGSGVSFTVLRHEPVFTSEQAAAVRGTSLASGAKALVVKAGDNFLLLVLPADRKLDSRRARDALRVKALRFASKEEVLNLTGLQPGPIATRPWEKMPQLISMPETMRFRFRWPSMTSPPWKSPY